MKGLTLTAFLLCGSSKYPLIFCEKSSTRCRFDPLPFVSGWILAAGSDPLVVEVQLGVNVTLQCSNISAYRTHAEWLRVVKGAEPSCVASMFDPHLEDSLCPGFESRKFKMTSDITNLFLHINRVDFSDSGLYFCGFHIKKFTEIPGATLLNVQGKIGFYVLFCLPSNKNHSLSDQLYCSSSCPGDPSDDNNSNHQSETLTV